MSEQLGTCNSEPRLAHTKANHGMGCVGWQPVSAPAVAAPAEGDEHDKYLKLAKEFAAPLGRDMPGGMHLMADFGRWLIHRVASAPPPAATVSRDLEGKCEGCHDEYSRELAAEYDSPDVTRFCCDKCAVRASTPADLEGKLRELADTDAEEVLAMAQTLGFEPADTDWKQFAALVKTATAHSVREAAALGRAEGLEEAAKLVRGFTPRKATYEQLANAIEELK